MSKQIDLKHEQCVKYQQDKDNGDFEKVEQRRKEIEDLISENGGELAREYERKKKEVGLDKSAYYQSYNGNQIHKALKGENPSIICSAFAASSNPKIPYLKEAFVQLGKMQSGARAIDLTTSDMEDYRRARNRFFEALEKLSPELNLTPKLHLLDCHVYTFMKRHQTWGKCAEQSIESKHAKFNKMARKHSNTKRIVRVHRTRILNEMWVETLNFINPGYSYEDSVKEVRNSENRKLRNRRAIGKGNAGSDELSGNESDNSPADTDGIDDAEEDVSKWVIAQEDSAMSEYDSDLESRMEMEEMD